MPVGSSSKVVASANWLNLQKKLQAEKKESKASKSRLSSHEHHPRKRQKLDHGANKPAKLSSSNHSATASSSKVLLSQEHSLPEASGGSKNGESVAALQQMILGHTEYAEHQKLPGKYLALDCEMVGVGIDGVESSLARVSIVNFHGAVILDEFVRQKERIVDYRTQWSGIRASDMVHAKSFEEVQKQVADLLQDKILVAHAVQNDLKALLLSHPKPQTRDTQFYAYKFGLCKTHRIALRNLVKQEAGLAIQSGEHSSVTDARATMAVYRLHKKEWEKGSRPLPASLRSRSESTTSISSKRKEPEPSNEDEASDDDDDEEEEDEAEPESRKKPSQTKSTTKKKIPPKTFPGGGRKGVSSGLSTMIHRVGGKPKAGGGGNSAKSQWWKELPGGTSGGGGVSKGSISIAMQR